MFEWIAILRDPACHGSFAEEADGLRCTRCDERYPIVTGVPIFAKAIVSAGNHRQRTIYSQLCHSSFEWYRTSEEYGARAIQNWKKMRAIRAMDLAPGAMVLDVGCSDGFWLRLMSAQYHTQGIGVDLADSIFVAAQQDRVLGFDNRFCLSEADRLPIGDEIVDFVISFDLLELLPKPEVALGEMVRVLKPGGRLLVHMPVRDYNYTLLWLLARFFPRYFRTKAERVGFLYDQIITSDRLREILYSLPLKILTLEKFGGWMQAIHDWYVLGFLGRAARFVYRRISRPATADRPEILVTPLIARPIAPSRGKLWRWMRSGYLAGLSLNRLAFLLAYFLLDWPLNRLGIGYAVYVLAEKVRERSHPDWAPTPGKGPCAP